jgi:quercetin dioxygenase-like cupin family protein
MLHRWDKRRDGPLSEAAMRAKLEALGYAVTRYVYPPGTFFDTHTHGVDKIDAVLGGRFRLVLEGVAVILDAGDAVEVPRGAHHSAEVIGDEPVVSLDAVRRESPG